MKQYLLNVAFYAGSDDKEDIDRGLYLLLVDKAISEQEMKKVFVETNKLLDVFNHETVESEFPISYEQGLNIDTLMEGIEIYTKGKVKKLCNNHGGIGLVNNYYVIEQWQ